MIDLPVATSSSLVHIPGLPSFTSVIVSLLCVLLLCTTAWSDPSVEPVIPRAVAEGFKETEIYHSKEKPGFTSWAALWREANGSLAIKFIERRTPKEGRKQTKLDVHQWEARVMPAPYDMKGLIEETVAMRSSDEGKTWCEFNRTSGDTWGLAPAALPDGRLLSATWGMGGSLIESRNGGSTWRTVREFMDKKYYDVSPFFVKLLSDKKTLLIYCPFNHSWGPDGVIPTRVSSKPGIPTSFQGALFYSKDFGKTLSGPLIMFPGIPITETDFCELPSGDLMFIQHGMYASGVCHRQLVRRTAYGFVPEEMEKISSNAPEIFVRTKKGWLVGASRNGPYVWSDDEGITWYPVEGAPNCGYQPRATLLHDDRVLFVWHKGGDNYFGEVDQYIGQHVFRLKPLTPRVRTKLALARDFDKNKGKYINDFTATLTTEDGKPIAGKKIEFSIVYRDEPGYEPFGGAKPWEKGSIITAETDSKGTAKVDYPEPDANTWIHKTAQLCARFNADGKDTGYVPASSYVMEYYLVTPEQNSEQ